jgi:hypothetical protein
MNNYTGDQVSFNDDYMYLGNLYTTVVIPNVTDLVGTPLKGNRQCAALAQAFGAPQTKYWVQGPSPTVNTTQGTVAATFAGGYNKVTGTDTSYNNVSGQAHTVAIGSVDNYGLNVVEQYSTLSVIQTHTYLFGGKGGYEKDGNNYFIVLYKVPK